MDWHKLALEVIPKNLSSYLVGGLVRLKFPSYLRHKLNQRFAKAFNLDMNEAAQPLEHYLCIEDVFTRTLKPGARTWADGFSSPADGTILRSAPLEQGDKALQVKGITYSAAELLYGNSNRQPRANEIRPYWYSTIYLAPHNYHRVHTPCAGTLTGIRYIPGKLWPVNERFTRLIPGLLCQNERLVFEITTPSGGKVCAVMVGAFNVGRIFTDYAPELTTNNRARQLGSKAAAIREKNVAISLAIGAELGVFMLGSTVVVICDEQSAREFKLQPISTTQAIKVGEKL